MNFVLYTFSSLLMSYCYIVTKCIKITFNKENIMTVPLHEIHGMESVPYNGTTMLSTLFDMFYMAWMKYNLLYTFSQNSDYKFWKFNMLWHNVYALTDYMKRSICSYYLVQLNFYKTQKYGKVYNKYQILLKTH